VRENGEISAYNSGLVGYYLFMTNLPVDKG